MTSLGLLDITLLITLMFGIYKLFNQLTRDRHLGKLLVKLPREFNDRYSMFFWICMGFFWTFFVIAELSKRHQYYNERYITSLTTYLIWIIICIIHILKIKYDREIRENGISIRRECVYWSDVIKYEWIDNGTVGITYYEPTLSVFKKETSEIWSIDPKDKERIDEILSQYINKGGDNIAK